MAYPRQYAHVSVSISDCQKIFALDRYTPEQIVDAVFSSVKTRSINRDQFIQTFKVIQSPYPPTLFLPYKPAYPYHFRLLSKEMPLLMLSEKSLMELPESTKCALEYLFPL